MTTFHFRVLTPLATVLECDVESVVAPLADGWLGLLPGHAPFAACLMAGEVLIRAEGGERLLATLGGALSVESEAVVVSTGAAALDKYFAELEQEIGDDARRRAALEREAEKQFDRVFREMAHTLNARRRRRG